MDYTFEGIERVSWTQEQVLAAAQNVSAVMQRMKIPGFSVQDNINQVIATLMRIEAEDTQNAQ